MDTIYNAVKRNGQLEITTTIEDFQKMTNADKVKFFMKVYKKHAKAKDFGNPAMTVTLPLESSKNEPSIKKQLENLFKKRYPENG